jgi:uncharacterized membrane protein
MPTSRLEAFSDGVLAIIITIMVLEMRAPHGASFADLRPLLPVFVSYVLSFIYLGIYWNNHHHLLHAAERVSGGVLWANLHLLFWLSLVPFVTGWMGENNFAAAPVALYGVVLLMAAVAYTVLQARIVRLEGPDSVLREATRSGLKEIASMAMYVASIPLAFWRPWASGVLFAAVAIIWLAPDRRIERAEEAAQRGRLSQ